MIEYRNNQPLEPVEEEVSLVLMSAPGAMAYYPKLGFALADNAYVIRRKR